MIFGKMIDYAAVEPFTPLYWSKSTALKVEVIAFAASLSFALLQTDRESLERYSLFASLSEALTVLYLALTIADRAAGRRGDWLVGRLRRGTFHMA